MAATTSPLCPPWANSDERDGRAGNGADQQDLKGSITHKQPIQQASACQAPLKTTIHERDSQFYTAASLLSNDGFSCVEYFTVATVLIPIVILFHQFSSCWVNVGRLERPRKHRPTQNYLLFLSQEKPW